MYEETKSCKKLMLNVENAPHNLPTSEKLENNHIVLSFFFLLTIVVDFVLIHYI